MLEKAVPILARIRLKCLITECNINTSRQSIRDVGQRGHIRCALRFSDRGVHIYKFAVV
jgi:hypothetical protein